MTELTLSNPITELVDLTLDAVALCNEGANSRAHIVFSKRKEKNSMKTFEEIIGALTPENAEVIKSTLAEKDVAAAALQKSIDELKAKQTETKEPKAAEDVLKSASPEVQKKFKDMQDLIDGLVASKSEEVAKARFEKCKAIPVEEATLKEILKSASPAVTEILEKAAAAIEKGTLQAKGIDGNPGFKAGTAEEFYSELEKHSKTIMSSNAGVTFEKAFTQACSEHPDIYKKYVEGVK